MHHRSARIALAVAVVVASAPLSLYAIQHGFGLAAMLTVPTCCLGFWFALVSFRRSQRIGWFAFASVGVALLPAGPWSKRLIEAVLNWVQHSLSSFQPTFLYSAAEVVAVFGLVLVPWIASCILGWLAARLARRLFVDPFASAAEPAGSEYRFTLRGMLLAITVLASLTALISSTVTKWQQREDTYLEAFLQRFTRSFTSGQVRLMAAPEIWQDQGVLNPTQKVSGIRNYRVVAPIAKNGHVLWAVWNFECNEAYPDSISRFGYAEARGRDQLPPPPLPRLEYLNGPTENIMIDGEPQLHTRAEIVDAPSTAKPGQRITIVAQTDGSMQCDLIVRPIGAVSSPPATIIAPATGLVRWEVQLNPKYRGARVDYEFQARTNPIYRAKIVRGAVEIPQQLDLGPSQPSR